MIIIVESDNSITNKGGTTLKSCSKYKIISKCSGKSLAVAGWSVHPNSNIHQWSYTENQENEQWILTKLSDGTWTIVSALNALSLDAENWGTADGTNVCQYYNIAQENQKWTITKVEGIEGNWYKVINVHSGLALAVSGASKEDGANVQTWSWNGSEAQLWSITELE